MPVLTLVAAMNTADAVPPRGLGFFGFLRAELAPFPGRSNVLTRCVLASALVILTSMTLEVPELALSILVVFYVTQSNVVVTRLVGAMFVVGSTLAIGTSIVLLKYTFDSPLERIVVASALFFASVYLMRILKVGIVFFIVAIVVIYVQSFVDRTDQAEVLVRAVLWVWVAVNYPIVVALLINAWLLPAEPGAQLRAELIRELDAVDARVARMIVSPGIDVGVEVGADSDADARFTPASARQSAVALPKLLKFQAMREHLDSGTRAYTLALVATVARIYGAAAALPTRAISTSISHDALAALSVVQAQCRSLQTSIAAQTQYSTHVDEASDTATHAATGLAPSVAPNTPSIASIGTRNDTTGAGPDLEHVTQANELPSGIADILDALRALADYRAMPADAANQVQREPVVAPDAWTNPAYARFSLKTLLAVLVCYVFYNAADWQGAHTIMLTCLIVALPSLGASVQRALLRIGGAAVGSVLALLIVVFVIPHLDGIAGLLLTVLPVIALGSWIAAGSERIGYAGVQIVFTCSLALFEHFGPTIDLTEIRDRMAGIALGVIVATVVQLSFWREGEGDVLRVQIAKLAHALAALVDPYLDGTRSHEGDAQAQLAVWSSLADCEAMLGRIAFEPGWQEGEQEALILKAQTVLTQCADIASAAIALPATPNTDALISKANALELRIRGLAESVAPRGDMPSAEGAAQYE